jgi:hypothetical protein
VHRGHLRPQPRRHHLVELAQRAQRRFADARHAAASGQPQAHRHGHRLVGVEEQRRQRGAGTELIAATMALAGVHRIAEVTQPFYVAAHAARGHRQPLGQLLTRPHPTRLQQPEQLQHAARRFGHTSTLTQS